MIGRCAIASPRRTFAPDNLRGLVLWLDASDNATTLKADNTPAANGEMVYRWVSKAGANPFAFVAPYEYGYNPKKVTNARNGLAALRFDEYDYMMGTAGPLDGGYAAFCAVWIYSYSANAVIASPRRYGAILYDANTGSNFIGAVQRSTGDGLIGAHYQGAFVLAYQQTRPLSLQWSVVHGQGATRFRFKRNIPSCVDVRINGDPTDVYSRRGLREPLNDRSEIGLLPIDPNVFTPIDFVNLYIGNQIDTEYENRWVAQVGEIILYDREQTPDNAARLAAYLMTKWNITP